MNDLSLGDMLSDIARQQYELRLIEQARDMVNRGGGQPTLEHVRILLEWLDGLQPVSEDNSNPATESHFL